MSCFLASTRRCDAETETGLDCIRATRRRREVARRDRRHRPDPGHLQTKRGQAMGLAGARAVPLGLPSVWTPAGPLRDRPTHLARPPPDRQPTRDLHVHSGRHTRIWFCHHGRPQSGAAVSTRTIGVVIALAAAVPLLRVAGAAVLTGGAVTAGCQPATATPAGAPSAIAGWASTRSPTHMPTQRVARREDEATALVNQVTGGCTARGLRHGILSHAGRLRLVVTR